MDNRDYIELFYNRIYEKDVNNKILDDKNYIVPKKQLLDYVNKLIEIPYIEFLNYIKEHSQTITYDKSDITQCSSFSACEIEMCKALLWGNNPGYQFIEIGKLFPTYVKTRNDGAYRKYGENQVKTASQLGIAFEYYNYWYLSCLGYIYPELSQEQKDSLLARTIIRNPFYQKLLLDLLNGSIKLQDYMSMLSSITIKRRVSSVYTLLAFCIKECVKNDIPLHSIIGKTIIEKDKENKENNTEKPTRKKKIKRLDAHINGIHFVEEDQIVYQEVLKIIGLSELFIRRMQLSAMKIVTVTKQYRTQIKCGDYWLTLPPHKKDIIIWLRIIAAFMKVKLVVKEAKITTPNTPSPYSGAILEAQFPDSVDDNKTSPMSYEKVLDFASKTLLNDNTITLNLLKKVSPSYANEIYIKLLNSGIALEEKPGVLKFNKLWGTM